MGGFGNDSVSEAACPRPPAGMYSSPLCLTQVRPPAPPAPPDCTLTPRWAGGLGACLAGPGPPGCPHPGCQPPPSPSTRRPVQNRVCVCGGGPQLRWGTPAVTPICNLAHNPCPHAAVPLPVGLWAFLQSAHRGLAGGVHTQLGGPLIWRPEGRAWTEVVGGPGRPGGTRSPPRPRSALSMPSPLRVPHHPGPPPTSTGPPSPVIRPRVRGGGVSGGARGGAPPARLPPPSPRGHPNISIPLPCWGTWVREVGGSCRLPPPAPCPHPTPWRDSQAWRPCRRGWGPRGHP